MFRISINIGIEFLFLDVVFPMNQTTELTKLSFRANARYLIC